MLWAENSSLMFLGGHCLLVETHGQLYTIKRHQTLSMYCKYIYIYYIIIMYLTRALAKNKTSHKGSVCHSMKLLQRP